jgi:dTDP-4-dehydrorhamnose 3,5-epimerase
MTAEHTPIQGLVRLRPRIFTDERGHFLVTFDQDRFRQLTGVTDVFVQDNESMSHAGVLRGLHFQLPPTFPGGPCWMLSLTYGRKAAPWASTSS